MTHSALCWYILRFNHSTLRPWANSENPRNIFFNVYSFKVGYWNNLLFQNDNLSTLLFPHEFPFKSPWHTFLRPWILGMTRFKFHGIPTVCGRSCSKCVMMPAWRTLSGRRDTARQSGPARSRRSWNDWKPHLEHSGHPHQIIRRSMWSTFWGHTSEAQRKYIIDNLSSEWMAIHGGGGG